MPTTSIAHKTPRSSGWTPARRAAQSAAIRRWSPWTQSTGPITPSGKARASRNSYKHGRRCKIWQTLRAMVAHQKRLHEGALQYNRSKRTNGLLNGPDRYQNPTNELMVDPVLIAYDRAIQSGAEALYQTIMQKLCIPPEPDI